MKYTASMDCSWSNGVDFSTVESTLLPNDFRLIEKTEHSTVWLGKGMASLTDNPIKGANKISLDAQSDKLHLDAHLGGILVMSLFICFLPPLLIFALSMFSDSNSGVINFLWVWFIIGPIVSYSLRRKTIKSLNNLLAQATLGQQIH